MLSRAILAGASAQIRNMATVGGNLMQRTRCVYFNDVTGSRCNKRAPGSGCDAAEGFNRYHAIIGASPSCIATHPSDMCVALAALDAQVHISGPDSRRTVPLVDFHRLPGERPDVETELTAGEVIISIEIPALPAAARSSYRKVRDRASYAFALVSVAAGVTMRDGMIEDVRLAFGGIAPKPGERSAPRRRCGVGPAAPESFRSRDGHRTRQCQPTGRQRLQGGIGEAHRERGSCRTDRRHSMSRMQNVVIESVKTVLGWVPEQWLPGGTPDPLIQTARRGRASGLPDGRSGKSAWAGTLRR